MLLASLLFGCGGVKIAHGLEEGEANHVLAALTRSGVQGSKLKVTNRGRSTFTVAVPRGDAVKAWQVLHLQNLPRQKQLDTKKSGGIDNLLATAQQRRARLSHAVAKDIAMTLLSVDGVVDARVHVVRPRRRPLAPDSTQPKPRASVLLRINGKKPINEAQVRSLVSGAVAGLKAKDVSVIILAATLSKRVAPVTTTTLSKRVAPVTATQVKVGPFLVAAGSRGPLLAACISATLLVLGLGLALLALVRRNRHLAAHVQRLTEQQEADEEVSRDLESSLGLLDHSFSHRQTTRRKRKK